MKACRPYKNNLPAQRLGKVQSSGTELSNLLLSGWCKSRWVQDQEPVESPWSHRAWPRDAIGNRTHRQGAANAALLPDIPYLRRDGKLYAVPTNYFSYYSLDRTIPRPTKSSIRSIPTLSLRDTDSGRKYRDDRMVCRKSLRVVQRQNLAPSCPFISSWSITFAAFK